jgi:hypothetical protein
MFNGASCIVNGSNVGRGKRFGGARARLAFVESGGFPAMGSQESLDVRGTVDFDVVTSLRKIDTVKGGSKAKVDERGSGLIGQLKLVTNGGKNLFRDFRIGAGNGEVIDLAAQENGLRTKLVGDVNVALVGGGTETKFGRGKNPIDVRLPEAAAFGMTLESTSHGNHHRSIKSDAIFLEVPISEDVVDGKKSGNRRARRVGIGILGITGEDGVVERGG